MIQWIYQLNFVHWFEVQLVTFRIGDLQGRDVFNEKPTEDEAFGAETKDPGSALPGGVVIHTSRGDITLRLFGEECPKTVENFTTHARNGYYDNVIFHRVIEKFMLQTGTSRVCCCPSVNHCISVETRKIV